MAPPGEAAGGATATSRTGRTFLLTSVPTWWEFAARPTGASQVGRLSDGPADEDRGPGGAVGSGCQDRPGTNSKYSNLGYMLMVRISRHRDHQDRRIVITGIAIVITGIAIVITGIAIVITRIAHRDRADAPCAADEAGT